MKIAFVTLRYNRKGGVERHTVELAERLSEMNQEVHVYTSEWEKIPHSRITLHKIPIIKINKPHFLRYLNLIVEHFTFAIMAAINIHFAKSNFDLIHAQKPGFFAYRDVITMHNCTKYLLLKKKINRFYPLNYLYLLLEYYVLSRKKFQKIITISQKVKAEILECYNVTEDDIIVLPHGVNIHEFSRCDYEKVKKSRRRYNLPRSSVILSFVANRFRRKGLRSVLQAISYLDNQNLKLIVIGGGNRRPYRRLAHQLNIRSKIIFTGHLSTEELKKHYLDSDIFVLPTEYDSFGMVITEAMACGLPVITTKLAGASELIEDGKNGFLLQDPKNWKTLANKIEQLADNAELRCRFGSAAKKKIKTITWEKVAERTLTVYEELASDPSNSIYIKG